MKNRIRQGSTDWNNTLRLTPGQLAFDPEGNALRVHDGSLLGGRALVGARAYTPPEAGPTELKEGTLENGYFGRVESVEMPTVADIALASGLSAPQTTATNIQWMKFSLSQKVFFVPNSWLFSFVSWEKLYQAGLIYGTDNSGPYPYPVDAPVNQRTVVSVDGVSFRVSTPAVSLEPGGVAAVGAVPVGIWPLLEKATNAEWDTIEPLPSSSAYYLTSTDDETNPENKSLRYYYQPSGNIQTRSYAKDVSYSNHFFLPVLQYDD